MANIYLPTMKVIGVSGRPKPSYSYRGQHFALESNSSVSTEVKPKLTKLGFVILQGRNRDKETRACIMQMIKQNQ